VTPEGEVKAHLKKRVAETGGELRFLKWIARNGAPDCFAFWYGPIMAFFETKQVLGRFSGHQVREHKRMRDAGIMVFSPRSKQDVDDAISELLKGKSE
jgi:hypothetical protein